MNPQDLISKITNIEELIPSDLDSWTHSSRHSFFITVSQFIKIYIGEESEFYKTLDHYKEFNDIGSEIDKGQAAKKVLKSVKDYLSIGLEIEKSENYQIKIDVISDFINQAIQLVHDQKYHPAAAGILMGASLEEFLKQLAEKNNIDLKTTKKSIDPISKKLYEKEVISKQDLKDIVSWAGIRNDATHGNFDEINDRKRIKNALEGVNLFMRKLNQDHHG
ncbi:hypothetical protein [Roseivirga pacifica]|uniref:hypothetical protein n=1 Tax=Roseivirga pacifica TaxID=1267423 RepID=UPI003BB0CCF0